MGDLHIACFEEELFEDFPAVFEIMKSPTGQNEHFAHFHFLVSESESGWHGMRRLLPADFQAGIF